MLFVADRRSRFLAASLTAHTSNRGDIVGIKDFSDKAKDALGEVREKAEDVAAKVVDKVDDATGGKVPDSVKDAVDKIDGETDAV